MSDKKRQFLHGAFWYSMSQYAVLVINMVSSIWIKGVLGVLGAGQWTLAKQVLTYSNYADLGAKNAMARELPKLKTAGLKQEVRDLLDTTLTFNLLTGGAASVLIGAASIFFIKNDPALRSIFLLLALLTLATVLYNYGLNYLRADKQIMLLSKTTFYNGVLVAACSLIGAWLAGVNGLIIGLVISTALSAVCIFVQGRISLGFMIRPVLVRKLIHAGLPMMIAGYLAVLFISVDVLMIGKWLGLRELGYYSIGVMTIQQISSVGRYAATIIMPYIQEAFGIEGSHASVRPYFYRATRMLALLLPMVITGAYVWMPHLTHWFLPQFAPGIPAMKILIVGYYFFAVNQMSGIAMFTFNRQARLVPLSLAAIGLAVLLNLYSIHMGFGLLGIAFATSAVYLVYFLVTYIMSHHLMFNAKEILAHLTEISGYFVYSAAVVWALEAMFALPNASSFVVLICQNLILILSALPLLMILERKENLISLMLQGARQTFRGVPAAKRVALSE